MSDCRGRDCGLDDCETCAMVRGWYVRLEATDTTTLFGYPVAIIRPGDRVLLTVAFPIPASAGNRIKGILQDKFPGAEFTIMDQVSGIAIERGE